MSLGMVIETYAIQKAADLPYNFEARAKLQKQYCVAGYFF